MKNQLPFTLLLVLFPFLLTAQDWQWITNFDDSNVEANRRITTDPFGNAYLSGQFNSNPLVIGGDTLETYTNMNYFIVKYDSLGQVIWTLQPITKTEPFGLVGEFYELTTDQSGNLYVAGTYVDSIRFGNLMVTSSAAPTNQNHAFVAKINPGGECLWLRNGDSEQYTWADDVTVDSEGNVFLGGTFRTYIAFGADTLWSSTSAFFGTGYIAKFDPGGLLLWMKQMYSPESISGLSALSSDQEGNLYIAARFREDIVYDNNTYTSGLPHSQWIAKLDNDGIVLWQNSIFLSDESNAASLSIYDLEVSSDGALIFTGTYRNSDLLLGTLALEMATERTNFIAKVSNIGEFSWVKTVGNIQGSWVIRPDLSIDIDDNIHFISIFEESMTLGDTTFFSSGSTDIFMGRFDPTDGHFFWGASYGSFNGDYGYGISCDPFGNAFICGDFRGSIDIDGLTLTSNGSVDAFVGKINFKDVIPVKAEDLVSEIQNINLFPNPNPGRFYIQHLFDNNKNTSWTINDNLGKEVANGVATGNENLYISTQQLPAGMYWFQITDGEKTAVRAFVVE